MTHPHPDAGPAAEAADTPGRKSARARLAEALLDDHDAAHAAALKLVVTTHWAEMPANVRGRNSVGPPSVLARLYAPAGKDWPRLHLSVRGTKDAGYALLACVKETDGVDACWETVRVPRGLLGAAGKLLMAADAA